MSNLKFRAKDVYDRSIMLVETHEYHPHYVDISIKDDEGRFAFIKISTDDLINIVQWSTGRLVGRAVAL